MPLHRKWTGYGTSRHFAAAQQFARIWSEADINHRAGFMSTRPTPSTILPSFILWAATASISAVVSRIFRSAPGDRQRVVGASPIR
jgi:hypothetical protein